MRNTFVYALFFSAQLAFSAHAANFAVSSSIDARDSNPAEHQSARVEHF
jgi:hypothetical protein